MMPLLRASALALALISVSACATPGLDGPPGANAPSAAQTATRAMLAAETAFNVAATAELDAKSVGLLTGANAERADGIRRQAYAALLTLRAVYQAGKTPDSTSLLVLTNQLLLLSGKTPGAVPQVAPLPTVHP